ncbi:MAG: hypothetical protein K0V04_09460 [Deltaproteobacteria bacterium]|nr:hypothetical protein [Deltaproteobacteria bacterium]
MSGLRDATRAVVALAVSMAAGACSNSSGPQTGFAPADEVATGGASAAMAEDDGDPRLDLGSGVGPLSDGCATLNEASELAAARVDIIFVIDNSISMTFEASEIQARMNDFSGQIADSGIDARVVLVSSYPDDGNGICIDPPLGGGGCPAVDNDRPVFTHIDERVGSHDAWDRLLHTHEQWSDVIRPGSAKHIVVVTDDTSNIEWMEFEAQFLALDPTYSGTTHHSVVCHSDCDSAVGIGDNYIALSNEAGGVAADLCEQDFQAVFDSLSDEVIAGSQLACAFEVPPSPQGVEFDPYDVDIEFDDGQGTRLPVGRVDSVTACAEDSHGWYYDDPVTTTWITLCPQTCNSLQGFADGSVRIDFGCPSIPEP